MGFLWNLKAFYLHAQLEEKYCTSQKKICSLRALNKIKRLLPPLGKKKNSKLGKHLDKLEKETGVAKLKQNGNHWKTFLLTFAPTNLKPGLLKTLEDPSLSSPPCLHPAYPLHLSFPSPLFFVSRWVAVSWCSGFSSRTIFLSSPKENLPPLKIRHLEATFFTFWAFQLYCPHLLSIFFCLCFFDKPILRRNFKGEDPKPLRDNKIFFDYKDNFKGISYRTQKLWPSEQNLNLVHLPGNIFGAIIFLLSFVLCCLFTYVYYKVYFHR